MGTKLKIYGGPSLILGFGLFFIRYVPSDLFDGFNIESYSRFCGTLLGLVDKSCLWVRPLNMFLILVSIVAVSYGIYDTYIEKNKK